MLKMQTLAKYINKKDIILSFCFSYIFSVFAIAGNQLKKMGMTGSGFAGKGKILILAIPLAIVLCVFVSLLCFLVKKHDKPWEEKKINHCGAYYLGAVVAVSLAYLPVFLAYYPAIMAYDFHRQSQEAMIGFEAFWPYQPIIHTWLYWLFFKIGGVFGSLEIGMAFYSLFQILILSLVLGYASTMIYRLTNKKIWYFVSLAFFALFPFFSVMSVEATKDVIFSALFVLFLLIFAERELFTHNKKWLFDLAWIATGTVLIQFRKNAIYAMLPFLIVSFFLTKKANKIRTLIVSVLLIVCCEAASFALPKIIGTEMKEPQIEKYSVVVQSFARVLYQHDENMNQLLQDEIEEFIPRERWENYNPAISDPVKWGLGNWDEDFSKLLKLWIRTGLKYPNEYIDSFLLTNAGYLFLDDLTWCELLGYGLEDRMGAIYTYNSNVSWVIPDGIAHESKFPWLEGLLEEIVSNNAFLKLPVVNVLFRPAFYTWFSLLWLLIMCITGQKKKIAITLFPVMYFLTLLFGPVACWRYIYPVALAMPVLLCIWLAKRFDNDRMNSHEEQE